MPKRYRSKIAGIIHRAMKGAYRTGVVSEAAMREFDATCLVEIEPSSSDMRDRAGASPPRKRRTSVRRSPA